MNTNRKASTVDQFCAENCISRAMLYKEWAAGRGPRRMKVGNRTLITDEAAADWRHDCEVETSGKAA